MPVFLGALLVFCGARLADGAHSAAVAAHHTKVAVQAQSSTLSLLAARFSHGHRRSGSMLHGRSRAPDTAEVVAALEGVAKSLEAEQTAAKSLLTSREKKCKDELWEYSSTNKAIRDGEGLISQATDTQATIIASISGLEASIDGIKGEITETSAGISHLTAELKQLRDNHKASEGESTQSLQQLDAVINRAAWQEEQQQRQRKHHGPAPSKLSHEVYDLRRLGRQLASAGGASRATRRGAALAFLQTGHVNSGSVKVLQADRRQLLHARSSDGKDFDEEEKKLINLIKGRRERLKQLEVDLRGQQLVLADKLRQSAETKRTLAMAERVVQRDRQVLDVTTRSCQLETTLPVEINQVRAEAINFVKMPGKLLYSMDAAMFLSKDLQALQAAPSFVQVASKARAQSKLKVAAKAERAELGQEVREALQVAAGASEAASEDAFSDSASRFGVHSALQQSSLASEHASGPFDQVEHMIRTLIGNLNDQGNTDTNLNQWCLESKDENEKTRFDLKSGGEQASTEILWSQSAISALEEQVIFFGAEIKRLEQRAVEVKSRRESEQKLLDKQTVDHTSAKEVLDEVVDVLKGECDIDESELALTQTSHSVRRKQVVLLQRGDKNKLRTKHGQCTEAVKLIMQAKAKIEELDHLTTSYFGMFNTLTSEEEQAAIGAAGQRTCDRDSAVSAKASRARDLETAKADKRRKEEDLLLVEEAAKAIDKKCIVKESHSERMARRQDEIDALKNAYDVINGETIPVDSSLGK